MKRQAAAFDAPLPHHRRALMTLLIQPTPREARPPQQIPSRRTPMIAPLLVRIRAQNGAKEAIPDTSSCNLRPEQQPEDVVKLRASTSKPATFGAALGRPSDARSWSPPIHVVPQKPGRLGNPKVCTSASRSAGCADTRMAFSARKVLAWKAAPGTGSGGGAMQYEVDDFFGPTAPRASHQMYTGAPQRDGVGPGWRRKRPLGFVTPVCSYPQTLTPHQASYMHLRLRAMAALRFQLCAPNGVGQATGALSSRRKR